MRVTIRVMKLRWNDSGIVCCWAMSKTGDITFCGTWLTSHKRAEVTYLKKSDGPILVTCLPCFARLTVSDVV